MRTARSALRTYRPRGVIERGGFEILRRSGAIRIIERMPLARADWSNLRAKPPITPTPRPLRALEGSIALYGGREFDVGWPPRWLDDPDTGTRISAEHHWTKTPVSLDVKDLWELSRLGWIGALLRASQPQLAATVISDWSAANPPFRGPNWQSAQEVALRAMVVSHALAVFGDQWDRQVRATVGTLLDNAVAHVRASQWYDRSQRNNHGLAVAGLLLAHTALSHRPTRNAEGRLRALVRDQFAPDGSYSQHSFTYQRLAMHILLWTQWAARQAGAPVGPWLAETLSQSRQFMELFIERGSGRLPNIGPNDGAQLLRLTDCAVGDFRPVLVHAALASDGSPTFEPGPWDEEAAWFGLGRGAIRFAPGVDRPSAFHPLRGPSSHALLRAGPLRHRLGHADQLNLDLWIDGENVVRDLGTFRYSAPKPWRNALAGDEVHNLPTVAGSPQARLRGRFFWLDWPEPVLLLRGEDHLLARLTLPRAVVERFVARSGDTYLIVDRVSGGTGRVRWNLPPGSEICIDRDSALATSAHCRARLVGGTGIMRLAPFEADPASGWESLTYGERSEVTSVLVPTREDGYAAALFAPSSDLMMPDFVDALAAATRFGFSHDVVRYLVD